MRAHYFQHVPFEGLGCIRPWLVAAGYEVTCTRFFESADLPQLKEIDFLIAMGGPMSVNDEEELPWLVAEKRFIRRALEAGKPVLGICLGAQLIASALGARVYPNELKEIGWFPLRGIGGGADRFRFPGTIQAFHWHGETFDLPPGAVHLARSDGCENQAFQIGRTAIGMQFHLETTPEAAEKLVVNCRAELTPSRYVQSERELLQAPAGNYRAVNGLMVELLSFLTRAGN
jgi:GMP synthase-like glutamine amidotransferase